MAGLARWNRLTLLGWLLGVPSGFVAFGSFWDVVLPHGPSHGARWYVGSLGVLIVCGGLGGLVSRGVGSGEGERPQGRFAGALLVPIGLVALGLLVLHLRKHGLPA